MDTRVYLHSRIFISVYGIEENVIKAESQEMKKIWKKGEIFIAKNLRIIIIFGLLLQNECVVYVIQILL